MQEIGRGSFGVVYRGVWREKVVSVKKINTMAEQRAFMIEVYQLSRVSHPNIIKMYGASLRKPICLIMELAEASLFDGGSPRKVLLRATDFPDFYWFYGISLTQKEPW